MVAKRYQKSRSRRRGADPKRIEKDAVAILDKRDIFVRDAGHYLVQSMSVDDMYYSIRHAGGLWTCDCRYYSHHARCKHVRAVQILLDRNARGGGGHGGGAAMQVGEPAVQCPRCTSAGYHETTQYMAARGRVPVYMCDGCGHRFVFRPGFKNKKFDDDVISTALFLCAVGLSLDRICEWLKQDRGMSVCASTIGRWAGRYSDILERFARTLPFRAGDRWSVDELYVLTYPDGAEKDCMYWLFVVMDSVTGLVLSYRVAPAKHGYDTVKLFAESVAVAGKEPKVIVSDALPAFREGISKAMPGAVHISGAGINGVHVHNNQQERLNGELKDNIGRARGYKSATPARVKLQITYHNFIHKTNGTIPSEAAGVFIAGYNKFKVMIRHAALALA